MVNQAVQHFLKGRMLPLLLLDKSDGLLELAALEWISYINHCRRAGPAGFRKRG